MGIEELNKLDLQKKELEVEQTRYAIEQAKIQDGLSTVAIRQENLRRAVESAIRAMNALRRIVLRIKN